MFLGFVYNTCRARRTESKCDVMCHKHTFVKRQNATAMCVVRVVKFIEMYKALPSFSAVFILLRQLNLPVGIVCVNVKSTFESDQIRFEHNVKSMRVL